MTDRPEPALVRTRLSVMMFLQYGIWGAWLPILYPFLLGHRQWSLDQIGTILAGGAVGAIIGPFIAGQIADRHFSTEKFLGVSHLVGAALVWVLAGIDSYWSFFAISVLYGLVYAPTLALTNSLSFHHLPDRDRDFGKVRLWGTVGWIAAGIGVGQWLAFKHTPSGAEAEIVRAAQDAGRSDAFKLSAILGLCMGVYCFTLPRTPPAREAKTRNAWLGALREARAQPLLTLFLLAVPISIIHQFYFVHTSDFLTNVQNAAGGSALADNLNRLFGVGGIGLMTVGQMSEVVVIAMIPLLAARRLGRKTLLGIGIGAYALRMAIFAYLPEIASATGIAELPLATMGVALHGLCFGCFIFVAFMVVDEQTTPDVRASAQNLFNLVIIGIGIIVGSWFATSVVAKMASRTNDAGVTTMDYQTLFGVPMWIAVACLVLLIVLYPRKVKVVEPAEA